MIDTTVVELKNGTVADKALVAATTIMLRHLIEPVVLYELIKKAHSAEYQILGDELDVLKNLSLLQNDGEMHNNIRNIVLSAYKDDALVNPIKEDKETI